MYYNQNDYSNIPYPSPDKPNATIKSGGCGVCAMAMLLEDLTRKSHPPDLMARYSISVGARVPGGTHMGTLCRAIAKDYALTYTTSSQAADALAALGRGAKVIANTGGKKSAAGGLFSSDGHYIYLRAVKGTTVTLWDSGYRKTKYTLPHRKDKVTLSLPDIYASMVDVDLDCSNRTPRYYILEDAMTYEQFKEHMAQYEAEQRQNPVSDWAKDAWQTATELKIFDGTMPQSPLTREQAAVVLSRVLGRED